MEREGSSLKMSLLIVPLHISLCWRSCCVSVCFCLQCMVKFCFPGAFRGSGGVIQHHVAEGELLCRTFYCDALRQSFAPT